MSKGSTSVTEFFRKIIHLFDTMSAVETPLSSAEFISYLLARLSSDYDAFVTSVTTRVEPLSPEDLYSLLLTHENRLSHFSHLPHSTNLSANFTSFAHGCGNYHGNNHGGYRAHGRGCTNSFPPPSFTPNSSTPNTSPLPH